MKMRPTDQPITLSSGRFCTLENPRIPFFASYRVLAWMQDQGEPTPDEQEELLAVALQEARKVATTYVGRSEGFTLIHSGRGSRRADRWHIHIVAVSSRWLKAWLYFVLCVKNVLQAMGLRVRWRA